MILKDVKKIVEKKLESNSLPTKVLQSKFKIGFSSLLYNDPTFMPFYFQLGKLLKIKNLIEFGFDLGIPSGCFLEGCGSIDHFLAFKKKSDNYFTKRLGISNIHSIIKKKFDLWVGDETDPEFMKLVFIHKWNCVIVCDSGKNSKTYSAYFDLVWSQLEYGGIIIVDFLSEIPVKTAFDSFCDLQEREPIMFNTLRGTGIIQK